MGTTIYTQLLQAVNNLDSASNIEVQASLHQAYCLFRSTYKVLLKRDPQFVEQYMPALYAVNATLENTFNANNVTTTRNAALYIKTIMPIANRELKQLTTISKQYQNVAAQLDRQIQRQIKNVA